MQKGYSEFQTKGRCSVHLIGEDWCIDCTCTFIQHIFIQHKQINCAQSMAYTHPQSIAAISASRLVLVVISKLK